MRQTSLFLGAKAGNAHNGTAEVLGLLQATDQPWAASLVLKGSLRHKSQLSVASAKAGGCLPTLATQGLFHGGGG